MVHNPAKGEEILEMAKTNLQITTWYYETFFKWHEDQDFIKHCFTKVLLKHYAKSSLSICTDIRFQIAHPVFGVYLNYQQILKDNAS